MNLTLTVFLGNSLRATCGGEDDTINMPSVINWYSSIARLTNRAQQTYNSPRSSLQALRSSTRDCFGRLRMPYRVMVWWQSQHDECEALSVLCLIKQSQHKGRGEAHLLIMSCCY